MLSLLRACLEWPIVIPNNHHQSLISQQLIESGSHHRGYITHIYILHIVHSTLAYKVSQKHMHHSKLAPADVSRIITAYGLYCTSQNHPSMNGNISIKTTPIETTILL